MTAAQRWQGRALTLEAAALIVVARALVALVPFRRWRALLGRAVPPERGDATLHRPENLAARRLARAVERAARRLPGESKCLPKAVALQRMLARRGLGAELVLGVRPEAARGGLDDLHAWVTARGEVVLGGGEQATFRSTRPRSTGSGREPQPAPRVRWIQASFAIAARACPRRDD